MKKIKNATITRATPESVMIVMFVVMFVVTCLISVMAIVVQFADKLDLLPNSVVTEEYIPVIAIVTEKEGKTQNTFGTHKIGNSTIIRPHTYVKSNNIRFSYNGIEGESSNKKLKNVEIGDKIDVFLYKGYNRDGKLVEENLKYEAK